MEFEFRDTIYVDDDVLDKWANWVRLGEEFDLMWGEAVEGWDDYEYVASDMIYEDVRREVYRRAGIPDPQEEEE